MIALPTAHTTILAPEWIFVRKTLGCAQCHAILNVIENELHQLSIGTILQTQLEPLPTEVVLHQYLLTSQRLSRQSDCMLISPQLHA